MKKEGRTRLICAKKLNNEINKEVNQTTNMPPIVLFEKE